jgi:hypothetical protein
MKLVFWISMAIAIAAVLRRAIALLTPANSNAPPQLVQLDAYFSSHATFTWIHILCALAFVCVLPFVFWSRTRTSTALQHGFFILGFVVAVTAYAMNRFTFGGWLERSAVLVFNTLYVVSLARAYTFFRRRDAEQQRTWTIRAVAILLGIATTRPVMGVFFATARLTHLTPHDFFGIAFWIGFSVNTVAIEFWLRRATAIRQ